MKQFSFRLRADGTFASSSATPSTFSNVHVFHKGYVACAPNTPLPLAHVALDLTPSRIADGFRRHGAALNQDVCGEYAAAIFDPIKRTLLLVQDALGLVSVYYSHSASGISVSTRIEDLTVGLTDADLDEEYIADYLCYGDHHGDRTPFKAIRRLSPGVAIEVRDNALRKVVSWPLGFIRRMKVARVEDCLEEFRHLLFEGIQAALPEHGTTLCELSGGLDSSTVTCVASQSLPAGRLHALSFVYGRSASSDESTWSAKVAEHCQLPWHKIDVDCHRTFSQLPSRRWGQPHHGMVNTALNNEYGKLLVESEIAVVLSGAGGDAVLYGDGPEPYYCADLLLNGNLLAAYRELSRWSTDADPPRTFRYWFGRCVASAASRKGRGFLIEQYSPRVPWLCTNFARRSRRLNAPRRTWVPRSDSVAHACFLEQILRSSGVFALREHSNDASAEFRYPLMYLPLLKFMAALPPELQFSPSVDRRLQREALQGVVPAEVLNRTSKGDPSESTYSGLESGNWWKAIRDGAQIGGRGYVDRTQWTAAVDLARRGRCVSIKHFKAAASLEVWLSSHFGPGVSRPP